MKLLKYILVVAAATVLTGCLTDNSDWCPPDGDGQVLIEVKVPGLTRSTRATVITEDLAEFDIDHLDVLVFEDRGGENDLFLYATEPAEKQTTHPNYPQTVRYVVPIRKSDGSQRQKLVMIANMKDEVAALLAAEVPDPETSSRTKAYLLDRLVFESSASDSWISPKPSARSLPMWGESDKSVIVTSTTQGGAFGTISMIFGLAKVDIAVNATNNYTVANGLDNFKLVYRRYYNMNSKGYAAPRAGSGISNSIVKNPSVPISAVPYGPAAQDNNPASPQDYFGYPYYLSEVKSKGADNDKCFFVVIGGYYSADVSQPNTSKVSYYRIDLYDRSTFGDPAANRLDILRGHHYMINVTGVDGPGYPTEEEAAGSVSTELDAEVIVWNEEGLQTDLAGQYKLNVSRSEFVFNGTARAEASTDNKFTVSTNYDDGWNITSITDVTDGTEKANTWLTASVSTGAAGVTSTVSINVGDYNGTKPRLGRIYIEAGRWTYVINVQQLGSAPEVAPFDGVGTVVGSFGSLRGLNSFVGAFWKADQTGERLITIPLESGDEGAWAVQVYEYGDDFRSGDIFFSTSGSSDPFIGTPIAADMNTNDDTYRVTDGTSFVAGTAAAGENIFFRIGLRTKWSEQSGYGALTKPARYAVIVLSYADYTKHQKLFVRQGHEADYVMYPGDGNMSGTSVTDGRNAAKKFSAYNLTAPGMIEVSPYYVTLETRSGTQTAYPSQAGAMFQHAMTNGYERRAYHPTSLNSLVWNQADAEWWNDSHETCPPGYRRPWSASSGVVSGNEFLQSLYCNVDSYSFATSLDNSASGFYADGYFDRRSHADYTGTGTGKDVAYRGHLVFNPLAGSPRHNASLFFPNAGLYTVAEGLTGTGRHGTYASSTSEPDGNVHAMAMGVTSFSPWGQGLPERALPVRCVVE